MLEGGALTSGVYAEVAVYACIACFVAGEGNDGVENEEAEEAQDEEDEDADVEEAALGEAVVMDAGGLGVMETFLVVNGIEDLLRGRPCRG